MTCYNPIRACYNKKTYEQTGRKDIHLVLYETFDPVTKKVIKDEKWILNEKSFPHSAFEYINLPCKKCVGCRSDNAKMWMIRSCNEMKMHDKSCFITLTYSDDSELVQRDPLCLCSLRYKHFQNFMKRLRKNFPGREISYIVAGEYGPSNGRSHWHAILYGINFDEDRELVYTSKGYKHYFSQILQDCWSTWDSDLSIHVPIGFTDLADADADCCAYVSQYVLKKLPIGIKEPVVGKYVDEFGELKDIPLVEVAPPIIRTSRNPAIGKRWYDKYGKNAVEKGFIFAERGENQYYKVKTPEYYYKRFEQIDPDKYQVIKKRKEEFAHKLDVENPIDRVELQRKSESHLYRIKQKIKQVLTKLK